MILKIRSFLMLKSFLLECFQQLPSNQNGDDEAIAIAREKLKAESASAGASDNRLRKLTMRALETASKNKMNGDQGWVSNFATNRWDVVLKIVQVVSLYKIVFS